MKKVLISILALLLIGSLYFFVFVFEKDKDISLSHGTISLCKTNLSYGLADSDKERKKGLSGRSSLREKESLLFVFEEKAIPSFWMKDMNFPIDIIWIDESKKIVDITEDFGPSTYPETVSPVSPVLYVLETRASFAKENHCIIGSSVEF